MKSIPRNLSSLLNGELTCSEKAREYFSTDGSIFKINPKIIIYPKNEEDIINTVRYLSWEVQEGNNISITARGKGTDQGGGALGDGAMLVFPAHMKALKDITKNTVTVQPGMIYSHLQGILQSHWRFLPPYPASVDFCTLGGAVANNSSGEKTLKYGSTRNWVKSLRVVLSNGDVITTSRLTKKQLKKKKNQPDYEGHIYREVDRIIEENKALLNSTKLKVSKNSTGYDLWDVKKKDGSFDLGQLFIGSQGTLGIVSEITFYTQPYNPQTTLLVAHFDDAIKAEQAVRKILPLGPSAAELVDYHTLEFIAEHNSEMLKGIDINNLPKIILLIEFDDEKSKLRRKKTLKAHKVLSSYTEIVKYAATLKEQNNLWSIRRGAAAVIWTHQGAKKALPIIEDGIVPIDKFTQYLEDAYKLFKKYNIKIATWGHAGNANMHIQPFLDLSNMRDRSKVFDLADDYYKMIIKLGGSTSAEHNDGIMRGPYLKGLFGAKLYGVFNEIKDLFDPLNFLNPTSKMNVTKQDAMIKMRKEYSMKHLHENLPSDYNH
ncbi:MAG TPA: FAD-binding oxidoreductase [Candidatus Saccharibacteria bacterium]|nr:FAD-binding oxidoreductase [Candidatus Saccharibacteria bacterium]HMT39969.1 FAD-binding oxidoreductase [Candidatus Saccharibacteria bacterium]